MAVYPFYKQRVWAACYGVACRAALWTVHTSPARSWLPQVATCCVEYWLLEFALIVVSSTLGACIEKAHIHSESSLDFRLPLSLGSGFGPRAASSVQRARACAASGSRCVFGPLSCRGARGCDGSCLRKAGRGGSFLGWLRAWGGAVTSTGPRAQRVTDTFSPSHPEAVCSPGKEMPSGGDIPFQR